MVEEKIIEENKITDEAKMDEVRHKIFHHPLSESMDIKRIPKQTVEIFKKFANEQFVGDYGFALKWMVDNLLVEDNRFQTIFSMLDDLNARLTTCEGKKTEPEQTYKVMMSGRKIPIPNRK